MCVVVSVLLCWCASCTDCVGSVHGWTTPAKEHKKATQPHTCCCSTTYTWSHSSSKVLSIDVIKGADNVTWQWELTRNTNKQNLFSSWNCCSKEILFNIIFSSFRSHMLPQILTPSRKKNFTKFLETSRAFDEWLLISIEIRNIDITMWYSNQHRKV